MTPRTPTIALCQSRSFLSRLSLTGRRIRSRAILLGKALERRIGRNHRDFRHNRDGSLSWAARPRLLIRPAGALPVPK